MANVPDTAQELLEWLMSHQITADELQEVLNKRIKEGLHLDYKHGKLLDKENKPCDIIREYMTAFANSAGGVLIVGIEDKTFHVIGAKSPNGTDLAEWASSCVQHMIAHFSPPPRFYCVNHSAGDVLVIAVERSPTMIPLVLKGQLVYQLRIHDKTIVAPEYLITDLLMGRRNRPRLNITNPESSVSYFRTQQGEHYIRAEIAYQLHNEGFVSAENLQIGVVSWQQSPNYFINNHLLNYLEVTDITNSDLQRKHGLHHNFSTTPQLLPFGSESRVFGLFELIFKNRLDDKYWGTWKAAVYIIANDMLPIWYQLQIEVVPQLTTLAKNRPSIQGWLDDQSQYVKLFRVPHGQRPVVGWDITLSPSG